MIKIYGAPGSSAGRCYWTMEEIGLLYERQPLDMSKKEHKSPEYLALNPNGKVPCLVDGDVTIWESMAIDTYLAEKYQPDLLGLTPEARGLVQQWSYWAILEPQPALVSALIQKVFVPEPKRDQKIIDDALAKLPPMLEIANKHLDQLEYFVGGSFSLADIHVATVMNINHMLGQSLSDFPHLMRWLDNVCGREAYQKVQAMGR